MLPALWCCQTWRKQSGSQLVSLAQAGLTIGLLMLMVRPVPAVAQSQQAPLKQNGLQAIGSLVEGATVAGPLAFIPDDALLVYSFRPKVILDNPDYAELTAAVTTFLADSPDPLWQGLQAAGMTPQTVEHLVWVATVGPEPDQKSTSGMAILNATPIDLAALQTAFGPPQSVLGGVIYTRNAGAVLVVGDRTLLVSSSETLVQNMAIHAAMQTRQNQWQQLEMALRHPQLGVLVNVVTYRKLSGPGDPPNPVREAVAFADDPFTLLLEHVEIAGIGCTLGTPAAVSGHLICSDSSSAVRVGQTVRGLLKLGAGTLRQMRRARTDPAEAADPLSQVLLPSGEALLASAKLIVHDSSISLTAEVDDTAVAKALVMVLPSLGLVPTPVPASQNHSAPNAIEEVLEE